jgi:hypothetical protein
MPVRKMTSEEREQLFGDGVSSLVDISREQMRRAVMTRDVSHQRIMKTSYL